jgi:hypothetical protein
MTKEKDWDKLALIEQAIEKKYGKEAVANPKSFWNEKKEAEYVEQLQKLHEKKIAFEDQEDKVEQDGFLISKKLLTREATKRICPTCQIYSFRIRDDVFMNKFDCCYQCYIKWVIDRESRWLSGWRPTEENK